MSTVGNLNHLVQAHSQGGQYGHVQSKTNPK